MIILSHPTGNPVSRALLNTLEAHKALTLFQTTVAFHRQDLLFRLAPAALRRQMLRRIYDIPRERIRTSSSLKEWSRLLFGAVSVDTIYREVDAHLARQLRFDKQYRSARGVFCYEDGALESFAAARELGLSCFYDLPIGYWRAAREINREEAEINSEWSNTWVALTDSEEKLARKDAELDQADVVFAPSSFVEQTLKLKDQIKAKIIVVPFGAPTPQPSPQPPLQPPPRSDKKELRAIFVGSLSQRKGISYLFDALAQLKGLVQLTVIGRRVGECAPRDRALAAHRWISTLPHAEVLDEIRSSDVLLMPSLFEGFSLTILEAMSCGVPVIITENAGAGDILRSGENGFLVPIRSSEAIAARLEELAGNRELLNSMKQEALATANRWTWGRYGDTVLSCMQEHLDSQ